MELRPFEEWYAMLRHMGSARAEPAAKGTDVVLDDLGGRRFGLAVAGDGPELCCLEGDRPALESVPWSAAALSFGLRGRDWIALSCRDLRVPNSAQSSPVGLRLWVPVAVGRLEAWRSLAPARLHLAVAPGTPGGNPRAAPFATVALRVIA